MLVTSRMRYIPTSRTRIAHLGIVRPLKAPITKFRQLTTYIPFANRDICTNPQSSSRTGGLYYEGKSKVCFHRLGGGRGVHVETHEGYTKGAQGMHMKVGKTGRWCRMDCTYTTSEIRCSSPRQGLGPETDLTKGILNEGENEGFEAPVQYSLQSWWEIDWNIKTVVKF